MINLKTVSLLDLLPYNLRSDATVSAAAQVIESELQQLMELTQYLTHFNRWDNLTGEETDEYAWQYHVDFYDSSLPLEQRRELVRNSYQWHRRKGTPSAVEELVATVFGSGKVEEWWGYGGDPYHFRVVTSDPDATTERAQQFVAAVNSVKNIRSRLEAIQITTEAVMDLYFGGIVHIGDHMNIEQAV